MKKVAILQSNYIPWKGYFDIISAVDEFVIYDEVQYTKNDWRNRNKIKTPKGMEWITIPAGQNIDRRICDVMLTDSRWQIKHWKTLEGNYAKAPHFREITDWLAPLYLDAAYQSLSEVNINFIKAICNYLDIETKITSSQDYRIGEGKIQRLVNICLQSGATEYVSGPAAKDYIDESIFTENKLKLTWFEYPNYPEYPQLWGAFEHGVTILDLLFNCGRDANRFVRRESK